MRYSISDTAEYGILLSVKIINKSARKEMKKLLRKFRRTRLPVNGCENRQTEVLSNEKKANHQIEQVGKKLRSMMSWIKT